MKIYIGHDARHKKATLVCHKSIKNHNPDLKVSWIDKSKLRKMNSSRISNLNIIKNNLRDKFDVK